MSRQRTQSPRRTPSIDCTTWLTRAMGVGRTQGSPAGSITIQVPIAGSQPSQQLPPGPANGANPTFTHHCRNPGNSLAMRRQEKQTPRKLCNGAKPDESINQCTLMPQYRATSFGQQGGGVGHGRADQLCAPRVRGRIFDCQYSSPMCNHKRLTSVPAARRDGGLVQPFPRCGTCL